MSKTILADLDGFTPVIDELAQEYGLVRAAVFGMIWRYCQMKDGVCYASLGKLSESLGVSLASVQRHAAELVKDGYLNDLTPGLRNKPHTYQDTGKAGIKIKVSALQSEKPASHSEKPLLTESNEDSIKKDSKREDKKEPRAQKPRERPEERAFQTLFCELSSLPESLVESEGKLAAGKRWYNPIHRMVTLADGRAQDLLRLTIEQMRRDHLSISAPQSIEKVFIAKFGEMNSPDSPGGIRYYE